MDDGDFHEIISSMLGFHCRNQSFERAIRGNAPSERDFPDPDP